MYATPIVAVIIGEFVGRYLNDWVRRRPGRLPLLHAAFADRALRLQIADRQIKRNKGVFEAEMRLWTCYVSMPPFVVGFCLLGAAFQHKLNVAAVIFGWGLAEYVVLLSFVLGGARGRRAERTPALSLTHPLALPFPRRLSIGSPFSSIQSLSTPT